MNALRIYSSHASRQLHSRLATTTSARLYASSSKSNPVPQNTPHTPDSYQKDDQVVQPSSSKTHVVSENHDEGPRTQRPFESPTGAYTTTDSSKPYDPPANSAEEEQSKQGYGGTESGGGGAKDVHSTHDSPQGGAGKGGRK